MQKDPKFNSLNADAKTKAKAELGKGGSVTIGELARKGSSIKAGENFAAIKSAYAGSVIERILNKIEEAGDAGVTPKEIMVAVGIKAPSQLNPIMRELMELGAISGPAPKEVEAEPEEITPEDDLANLGIPKVTDNPEDKEVDDDELIAADDEYYKPEEEEDSTEEEPKALDIKAADKEAEKVVGGKSNAKKLSPEDEEKYTKESFLRWSSLIWSSNLLPLGLKYWNIITITNAIIIIKYNEEHNRISALSNTAVVSEFTDIFK